jgi:hypothetical protein
LVAHHRHEVEPGAGCRIQLSTQDSASGMHAPCLRAGGRGVQPGRDPQEVELAPWSHARVPGTMHHALLFREAESRG